MDYCVLAANNTLYTKKEDIQKVMSELNPGHRVFPETDNALNVRFPEAWLSLWVEGKTNPESAFTAQRGLEAVIVWDWRANEEKKAYDTQYFIQQETGVGEKKRADTYLTSINPDEGFVFIPSAYRTDNPIGNLLKKENRKLVLQAAPTQQFLRKLLRWPLGYEPRQSLDLS